MVCTRLSSLLEYEVPHYQKKLNERKVYFDILTGYDTYEPLVERDFQKRFFQKWAEHERVEFCAGCDANGSCSIKH